MGLMISLVSVTGGNHVTMDSVPALYYYGIAISYFSFLLWSLTNLDVNDTFRGKPFVARLYSLLLLIMSVMDLVFLPMPGGKLAFLIPAIPVLYALAFADRIVRDNGLFGERFSDVILVWSMGDLFAWGLTIVIMTSKGEKQDGERQWKYMSGSSRMLGAMASMIFYNCTGAWRKGSAQKFFPVIFMVLLTHSPGVLESGITSDQAGLITVGAICILALPFWVCRERMSKHVTLLLEEVLNSGLTVASQTEVLVTFYDATRGSRWRKRDNWCSEDTNCVYSEWYGVHTLTNKHSKILPMVEAFNSTHLVKIQLHNNNLCGALPKALGQLCTLRELNLAENNLEGGRDS
jgi:hypothetical protein